MAKRWKIEKTLRDGQKKNNTREVQKLERAGSTAISFVALLRLLDLQQVQTN